MTNKFCSKFSNLYVNFDSRLRGIMVANNTFILCKELAAITFSRSTSVVSKDPSWRIAHQIATVSCDLCSFWNFGCVD